LTFSHKDVIFTYRLKATLHQAAVHGKSLLPPSKSCSIFEISGWLTAVMSRRAVWQQFSDVSAEHVASIFRVGEARGVIMQTAISSNVSVNFYQSTRRHIPFIIMCNCCLHAGAEELF